MEPKLRFKEFSGDWEEKRLGDIYEFKNGLNKEKEFFGKGTPIVNYMDVNKNTHLYKNTIKGRVQLTKKEIENYSAKKGDLFFTRTSEIIDEIGYTAVLLDDIEDTVFSGFILRARPKNRLIDFKFSGYCFMTRKVRKEIIKKSSMTTRALTSGTSLKQVVFCLPSLPEQTKIADFLSTVDDKIQNQQDKITHLENIKKGFMQKIFSRKIRFKDDEGNEFPDWEEKKLEEAVISLSIRPFQIQSKEYLDSGKVPVIDQGKSKYVGYTNDDDKKFTDLPIIIYGDHTTFVKYSEIPFVVGADGVKLLKCIQDNSKYIYYAIEMYNIVPEGYKRHFSIVKKINLPIPCLEEQQKIADFLSSFDEKIDAEKETLEHLKELKKGLLQQMFV